MTNTPVTYRKKVVHELFSKIAAQLANAILEQCQTFDNVLCVG